MQLDRITPFRLTEFIHFLQAKLIEHKNYISKQIIPSQCPFLSPQLAASYSHYSLKEGICFLDCFEPNQTNSLLALHEICYESYPGAYEGFLEGLVGKKWSIPLSQAELTKEIKTKLDLLQKNRAFIKEKEENIAITFEFGRNFNEFPFKPFLKLDQIKGFRKKLFDGLLLFTLIEEKYISTSVNNGLFPFDYKQGGLQEELIKEGPFVLVPENNRFSIWGLYKDHIRVILKTNPMGIYRDLGEVIDYLMKIGELFNGGYKFHKNFGYLAENALDLGFNTSFSIESKLEEKKIGVLKKFCKGNGWVLEELKENKGIRVRMRRPNWFIEELDLINSLLKALMED